jgi:hypothetical protein
MGGGMRWARRCAWGLVVVALLVSAGFAPGGSPHTTIDHCYVKSVDWEPGETECTGHWTLLGRTFSGRVYGVDVPGDWQALQPSRSALWYEVTVPDDARDRQALAVPGASVVNAWLVWIVRAALVLAAALILVMIGRSAIRWRRIEADQSRLKHRLRPMRRLRTTGPRR